ncbi:MAG: hypothetical protein LAT76_02275 [Schleiferiaceae bacterium]|nr:hypothetical protein [Schleiferiaceae bacterium]
MKQTLLSLSCVFFLSTITLHAQSFQFREAGVNFHALSTTHDFSANIPDRLPNSALVQQGFDRNLSNGLYSEELMSALWLGFHGTKNEKHGPVLRVGLIFGSTNMYLGHFQNRFFQTVDTFTSGTQVAYLDSIDQIHYNISHRSSRFGLQAQYLYYWNKQNRFSLYGGLGLGLTTSFGGRYTIDAFSTNYTQFRINNEVFQGSRRFDFENKNQELERFSTGVGYAGFVSIPIGLDFRIGTNPDNFWGKTHMFWEIAPSFNYLAVDPDFPVFFMGLIQSFGFRVEW